MEGGAFGLVSVPRSLVAARTGTEAFFGWLSDAVSVDANKCRNEYTSDSALQYLLHLLELSEDRGKPVDSSAFSAARTYLQMS